MAINSSVRLLAPPSIPDLPTSASSSACWGNEYVFGDPGYRPHSPGTQIAARLSDLQLKSREMESLKKSSPSPASELYSSPSKRRRFEKSGDELEVNPSSNNHISSFEAATRPTPAFGSFGRSALERAECVAVTDSDEESSSNHAPNPNPATDDTTMSYPPQTPTKLKRRKSPPPPPPQSTGDEPSASHDSLTWHNFEITGHLAASPDDDGYGLNGIGFKPTPAIAYARAQKRKQQISAWRAREAREARQRRFEKRRHSIATGSRANELFLATGTDNGCGNDDQKRMVRFA